MSKLTTTYQPSNFISLSTKEEKVKRLLFAISRAKDFIVEDPQHAEQYKANIKNAYGHLAILESA